MEPRIETLLDQSPYRRFTLDPSLLLTSRHVEPAFGVDDPHSNRDSRGNIEHVESRNRASLQTHSDASLARVLNDPTTSSQSYQPISGRQIPQHAAFRNRNDDTSLGSSVTSPDARRRDEGHNHAALSGGDISLIQLPKPPQVPRRTAKRPRIPPLLQGLHQPPPLPPKNRLFPPITSDRSGLGSDVGDRFNLGNAYPTSSTEDLAQARVNHRKEYEVNLNDTRQLLAVAQIQHGPHELDPLTEPEVDYQPPIQSSSRAQSQNKAPRKRNRWSQKETEDLLIGVSRFGIGRWKQILDCTDFQFQGRNAVDLKDRFRVCRPGEGLKVRKALTPGDFTSTIAGDSSSTDPAENFQNRPDPPIARVTSKKMSVQDSPGHSTTGKAEIYGPFLKSKRRARREFSDADDKNLLKGFKRHGPVWHSMRDDFELGFGMRHPTDLRDRFRIRYPELFAKAGFKLKPKEERALKDRADEAKAKEAQISGQSTTAVSKKSDKNDQIAARTAATMPSHISSTTTTSHPDPSRPTFDVITDLTFSDSDDDRTPIILNRNILQWADENSSVPAAAAAAAAPAQPSTHFQSNTHVPSDVLYNPFPPSDGLHINPLATLKLPSTAHWPYTSPPTSLSTSNSTAIATSTTANPSLPPLKTALPTSNSVTSSANATQAVTKPRPFNKDANTTNLPNIVFPYVPRASARGRVHNLPPPKDILSERAGGMDGWVGGV